MHVAISCMSETAYMWGIKPHKNMTPEYKNVTNRAVLVFYTNFNS
jgi:hypothetical protein